MYVDSSPSIVSAFPTPAATDRAFHDGLWAGRLEGLTVGGVAYFLYDNAKRAGEYKDEDGEYNDEDEEDVDDRILYERELAETRALMQELKEEHGQTDPLVTSIQKPADGRYVGSSAEDDDGDQPVAVHLEFKQDGTVQGWGYDGVDGRYVLTDGVWSTTGGGGGLAGLLGARVAWIEQYDEGFQVALRGQVRADGTIRALWASTVGVSGSVDLARD